MRSPTLVVCVLVAGCAGRYRTEFVGHGTAIVQARGDAVAPAAAEAPAQPDEVTARAQAPWGTGRGIQLPAGTYELAMTFDVPRAQQIEWTIACPGVQQSGTTGETLARYRERRLAELRAQVQRDRERTATVTSAVVGAFAPRVVASGTAGPLGVHAEARVNGDAVGDAVALSAIPDDVVLPADDVGRGRLAERVHVTTTGAGMCVVTAIADDASVYGAYAVSRVRDLEAEARQAALAERTAAMSVRTRLQARLVAHGADAELHQRQQRAEIEARYAAEAKARADLELRMAQRAELEETWRIEALHARAALRGRCVGHGADPERRQRIAAEQRAATETEARLRVDLEQRRLELALHARTSLRDRWVRFGAIPRPPMPDPLDETPGAPPFDGAVWIAGQWTWLDGRWSWTAGGWSDPDVFTEVGGSGPVEVVEGDATIVDDVIDVAAGVGALLGGTRQTVRDHRRAERERVRDHRTPTRSSHIRDHRSPEHREIFTPTRSDPPPRETKRDDEKRADRNDSKGDDKRDSERKSDDRFSRDHRR